MYNTKQFRALTIDQVLVISHFKITSVTAGPRPDSVLIHLQSDVIIRGGCPEAVVLRESESPTSIFTGIKLVYSNTLFISYLESVGCGFKE